MYLFKMVWNHSCTELFRYCQSEKSDAVSRHVLLSETHLFIIFWLTTYISFSKRRHANTSLNARQPVLTNADRVFLLLRPPIVCILIARMHGMHGFGMVYNKMTLIIFVFFYPDNNKHTGNRIKIKETLHYKLLVLIK